MGRESGMQDKEGKKSKERRSSASAAAASKDGEKPKRGRPSKSPGMKKERTSKGIKKGHRK